MNRSLSRSREMDTDRRFPVRLRVAVPAEGYGSRLAAMHDWLRERVGNDGFGAASSYGQTRPRETHYWYLPSLEIATEFAAAWPGLVQLDGPHSLR